MQQLRTWAVAGWVVAEGWAETGCKEAKEMNRQGERAELAHPLGQHVAT